MRQFRGISIVVDCADTMRLAAFWRELMGGEINTDTASTEWVALEGIAQFDYLGFQQVPEGKIAKNRTHIDVMVDEVETSRDYAVGFGAKAVGDAVEQEMYRFQVMLDPEQNEFCFVQRIQFNDPGGS